MDAYPISRTIVVASVALGALSPCDVDAAAFSLLEQSVGRLGSAFSGTTVVTEDASAMYFNPAGLAKLDAAQFVLSASGVSISSEFRDESSQAALGQPLGTLGGDAGGWNAVPSAYFALPINDQVAFGFGFNVGFGLKLEYSDEWMGRFQALNSEIQTYNFNPALAWEINDTVTLGIGVNYQRVLAELTSAVNYTAIIAGAAPTVGIPPASIPGLIGANLGLQGAAIVRGDDSAWGFNVGALFQLTPTTRLGIGYRMGPEYEVEGWARFEPPTATNPIGAAIIGAVSAPGGRFASTPATVDLNLPDIVTASLSQRLGDRWELLVDVAWAEWSSVQELRVERPDDSEVSTTPELWDDSWRFALGTSYQLNDAWKLRFGVAYDNTPVPDSTRTPRLPDPDRTWVAIGARYDTGEALVFDFGYAHLFSDDVPLNQDAGNAQASGLLIGEQESAIDIVGVQVGYRF